MDKRIVWYQAVADCEARGEPYVLVTVLGVAGSVPREPASKMVISAKHAWDTIGGGHLEYQIMARAREYLASRRYETQLEHFPLGASLGQCCGGSVSVLLESQPGSDARLVVFGAGHVGRALMTIMAQLPWQVTWVDSRPEAFPEPAELPTNVRRHLTEDPVGDAAALCSAAHVLILTHNHQLDYELCRALLNAADAASIGLIGSRTKAERFRMRLQHRGYSDAQIASIRCPVGRTDVPGKRPMEVAVSICAELLSLTAPDQPRAMRRGISWPALREILPRSEAPDHLPTEAQ